MADKILKCPECDFRTCTMKGINIHRRKKHEKLRIGFRGLDTACIRRLMGRQPFFSPSSPRLSPVRLTPRPTDFDLLQKYQRSDWSSTSGFTDKASFLDAFRVFASDTAEQPLRSIMFPKSTFAPLWPAVETNSASSIAPVVEEAQDLRVTANHVSASTTTPCRASRESLESGSVEQDVEPTSCTPQQNLTEGPVPAANTSEDLPMANTPLAEQPAYRQLSDAVAPRAVHSTPNKHGTSARSPDDHDDKGSSLPCLTVRDLLSRVRSTGRKTLKNVWPSCFADIASMYSPESGLSPQKVVDRKICEITATNDFGIFLELLGSCPVLDYDSSSLYELVLRCSSCEKPMNGIRNMESHIREHINSSQHPRDIPCKLSRGSSKAPNSGRSNIPDDVAFKLAGITEKVSQAFSDYRNPIDSS